VGDLSHLLWPPLLLQETLRQQDWKIERLTKDNRALEAANVELRARLDELRDENLQVGHAWGVMITAVRSLVYVMAHTVKVATFIAAKGRNRAHTTPCSRKGMCPTCGFCHRVQVSEKIIALDEEARSLRLREAELEARGEAWAKERSALLATQEELRAELREKLTLLDEFEERFSRQYRYDACSTGGSLLRSMTSSLTNADTIACSALHHTPWLVSLLVLVSRYNAHMVSHTSPSACSPAGPGRRSVPRCSCRLRSCSSGRVAGALVPRL
jgi:hypothetical protein